MLQTPAHESQIQGVETTENLNYWLKGLMRNLKKTISIDPLPSFPFPTFYPRTACLPATAPRAGGIEINGTLASFTEDPFGEALYWRKLRGRGSCNYEISWEWEE